MSPEGASAPLSILLTGIAGRMGATLARMVNDAADLRLVGGTERRDLLGRARANAVEVFEDLTAALAATHPAVVIDFTSADASAEHARICAERRVPLVIGSTGLSSTHRAELERAATKIPIVAAPNMSVGVNVVVKVAADLARKLGEGFDVEIVEAHHRMKKDAPSGTALRLAEEIAHATDRSTADVRASREGQIGERSPREIGVQSIRGGDVVGEHTVFFLGDGERVELTHRATSRDQFARGALRAARWIAGRVPGLYGMDDVLGIR